MPPGEWPTEERELVIQRLRTIHEVLDGSRASWQVGGHRGNIFMHGAVKYGPESVHFVISPGATLVCMMYGSTAEVVRRYVDARSLVDDMGSMLGCVTTGRRKAGADELASRLRQAVDFVDWGTVAGRDGAFAVGRAGQYDGRRVVIVVWPGEPSVCAVHAVDGAVIQASGVGAGEPSVVWDALQVRRYPDLETCADSIRALVDLAIGRPALGPLEGLKTVMVRKGYRPERWIIEDDFWALIGFEKQGARVDMWSENGECFCAVDGATHALDAHNLVSGADELVDAFLGRVRTQTQGFRHAGADDAYGFRRGMNAAGFRDGRWQGRADEARWSFSVKGAYKDCVCVDVLLEAEGREWSCSVTVNQLTHRRHGDRPPELRGWLDDRIRDIARLADAAIADLTNKAHARTRGFQGRPAATAGFFLARPAPCPGDAPKGL